MELNIWSGDWGLPSVHYSCLSALAYCKFTNVPVDIKKTNSPWSSPSGNLPVLKTPDGKQTEFHKIFQELQKQGYNLDESLSGLRAADSMAFTALVEEKLHPGLLHLWWVDARVYTELTRPWYAKAMGLPLSLFLPQKWRNKITSQLRAPYLSDNLFSDSDLEKKVYRDAKECLNLLSTKLGNNNYFFADRPTSYDAFVFGYLAPLLNMPISNPLQVHLKSCRNLVNFCQRILTQYFPLSQEELEAQRKKDEAIRQRTADETEYPNRKRNMFLAGFVAVAAMTAYALLTGIVQVEFVRVDRETKAVRDETEVVRMSGGNGAHEDGD